MDEKYWDDVAVDFEGEIFNVFANDRRKVILKHIRDLSSKDRVACDFGCGTGRLLPVLANRFRRVYATDISEECLDVARKACDRFDNIEFMKVDLADEKLELPKAHFGVSINTAILPSDKKCEAILETATRHVCRRGYFLLVVPSLESVLHANFRLAQWRRKNNGKRSRASAIDWDCLTGRKTSIPDGIIDVNGVGTKHYLKENLVVRLESKGLKIMSVEKVEYAWDTEFDRPPKWMNDPRPWDWLVLARKN